MLLATIFNQLIPPRRGITRHISATFRRIIHRMVMLRDILCDARPLALPFAVIVLLAMLEQAILANVIMPGNLRRIV